MSCAVEEHTSKVIVEEVCKTLCSLKITHNMMHTQVQSKGRQRCVRDAVVECGLPTFYAKKGSHLPPVSLMALDEGLQVCGPTPPAASSLRQDHVNAQCVTTSLCF
jgi:hypothetical protein